MSAIKEAGDSCEVSIKPDVQEAPTNLANEKKGDVQCDVKDPKVEYLEKIKVLEKEVEQTANERNEYRKKLEEIEKKLENLQFLRDGVEAGNENEIGLRIQMEDLKNKLIQTQLQISDRNRLVSNQENQIKALNNQVVSLKEVIQITKDLLNIRNMEVKHLQGDVDNMESRISAERDRHKNMKTKMDTAVRLNEDLKKEYETQLQLFQDLRGQYEKKVTLLTEENKSLEESNQTLKSSM